MRKGKNFIINYSLYPFQVLVSVGETDKQFEKLILKCGISKKVLKYTMDDTRRLGHSCFTNEGITIIRLKYYPNNAKYKGILAHECFHAVSFLMENIGVTLSNESDEAWAYAIDFLTQEMYRRL